VPRCVVEATARSAAPRDVVWEVLADGASWSDWGVWDRSELERPGDSEPQGLGAIRLNIKRPLTMREHIVVWEPPSRFGYELLSGLPVRGYRSIVTLTEAGDDGAATNIHWESRFDGRWRVLDRPMRAFMRRTLNDVSARVAAEAERRAA
jgi:hypothetical protein